MRPRTSALLVVAVLVGLLTPAVGAAEPGLGAAPVVTSITPDEFSIYEGGPAVVTGAGFVDVTEVTAAGMAVGYAVVSATELHITVPPRVVLGAASAPLTVTTSQGSSAQNDAPTVNWIAPPEVSSISSDSDFGGSAVINGQSLDRVTSVTVDGDPIPFAVVSDEQVSITLPPHAPGFVEVMVHTSLYETSGFTRYYDPPSPATLPARAEAYNVSATYRPLVGDFDGNQVDDVFWYAPGSTPDYMWRFAPDGTHTSISQAVSGTYRPVVGDFGFDGVDDILWYGPGSAADSLWDFNPGAGRTIRSVSMGGDYVPIASDFTGDGSHDVFWYASGSAPDPLWVFTYGGNGSHSVRGFSVTGAYRPVAGDFSGDSVDDIAWYAPGSAADSIWDFNADGSRTTRPLSVNGTYNPVGGDFTRDGVDDVLWYAPGTASDSIWDFNPGGSRTIKAIALNGTWRMASGDLTGGGITDLVLHGPGTATDAIWFLSPVVR